jgi:hypothetical protein
MSAEVCTLPGVFRADLEEPTPPAKCLQSALDANLKDVAIVGRDGAGQIVLFGSHPDADATIGLLTRGAVALAGFEQVPPPAHEDSEA